MLLSRTAYRVALFHLSVNPVIARVSFPAACAVNHHLPPQAHSSRLHTILFPQCAPHHKLSEQSCQAHTMSSSDCDSTTRKKDTNQSQPQEESSTEGQQEQLYLPDIESTSDGQQKPVRLDLGVEGGSTVTLDHLGPMVVNVDGTLSRIGNWEQMTEIERKNTLRILGKRNKQRLEALKAAQGGGEQKS